MDDEVAAQVCAKLDALAERVEELRAKVDAMATAEAILARAERRQEPHLVDARRPRTHTGRVPRQPDRHLYVVRGDPADQ